jgi:GTPase SAR1 family protein
MQISFFDYRPTLVDLDFKSPLLENLSKVTPENLLNLIVYGPSSSGKTTKIYAFLASMLDKKVYDVKNNIFEEDRKTINYKSSIYHIEIDPICLGSDERFFIQSFLKSYTETKNIGLNIPKIILIKNAHLLSKQTQMSLRKTMEKASLTARFIFEISKTVSFSEALFSRSFFVKVPLPKESEVKEALINYSKKYNHSVDEEVIDEIISDSYKISNRVDLKKVFGFYNYYVSTKNKFHFLYYDKFAEILNYITSKKITFVTLQKIREIVNELYINLVPMSELLEYLFNNLSLYFKDKEKEKDKYKNDFIEKLLNCAIKCDINLNKGNKECLHLEHFIISAIELLEDYKK